MVRSKDNQSVARKPEDQDPTVDVVITENARVVLIKDPNVDDQEQSDIM